MNKTTKGKTMAIAVTRTEVLSLMDELPVDHFLQSRLFEELARFNTGSAIHGARFDAVAIDTEPAPAHAATEKLGKCIYTFYGHPCDGTTTGSFCDEHLGVQCTYREESGRACGRQIDHGCPVELQFVCGAPLCCEHSTCKHYR